MFQDKLQVLAAVREEVAFLIPSLRDKEEEAIDGLRLKYAEAYDLADRLLATKNLLESEIRAAAQEQYVLDKQKHPCPGLNIAVETGYEFDANTALAWAKDHQLCLVLDTKAFEALCKTTSRPPFVSITTAPKAKIAADLRKLYPKKEALE